MPVITATYGQVHREGRNLVDRATRDEHPGIQIKLASQPLASWMESLAKVNGTDGKARSAFSCAEAQALSRILRAVGAPVDWTRIRFFIATDETGHELWAPCENCSAWLEHAGGFGSERTYKISEEALTKINGAALGAAPSFNLNAGSWPALGSKP